MVSTPAIFPRKTDHLHLCSWQSKHEFNPNHVVFSNPNQEVFEYKPNQCFLQANVKL